MACEILVRLSRSLFCLAKRLLSTLLSLTLALNLIIAFYGRDCAHLYNDFVRSLLLKDMACVSIKSHLKKLR